MTEPRAIIEPLDVDKYVPWSFKIKQILTAKGLWKYATGLATLASDAPLSARAAFEENDEKALALICMYVEELRQTYCARRLQYLRFSP